MFGLFLCFATSLAQLPPAPRWPELGDKNLASGKKLFLAHCSACHGPRGDGGRGANLAQRRLRHAPDDLTLMEVIRNGILGTEMPPTRLSDREAWQVAAYVRSLSRIELQPVSGNPSRGMTLFWTKGNCGQCHTVGDRGGRMGPDLTDIGSRRNPSHLLTSLLDPEASVPENFALYRRIVFIPDNFLQVRVLTKDGQRLTGIRMNEDAFSIQIRDFSDRIHSFWKSELVELHKDWGKSPMPSYRSVFSATEVEDIVAYLVSLRDPS